MRTSNDRANTASTELDIRYQRHECNMSPMFGQDLRAFKEE